MPTTINRLLEMAQDLSVEDQRLLATKLMERLDPAHPDSQASIDAAWEGEIARRWKEIEDGTAKLLTEEESLAELEKVRARYAQR